MNNEETEKIKELSIQELLCGEDRYEIPLYQRNYAWERGEIEQLIQDVIDYIPKNLKATTLVRLLFSNRKTKIEYLMKFLTGSKG